MSVTSSCKFGWKRKIGALKTTPAAFNPEDQEDHSDILNNPDVDWLSATKCSKVVCLEDATSKSKRLREEGMILAEAERYWEAIQKWNEAVQLTPDEPKLYEMKAQALMILCEVFPAMVSASQAVKLCSNWWVGHQTLGRTQLNLGEVKQAVKSFSKAVHLNPSESDLWKEDLLWACSLLTRKDKLEEARNTDTQKQDSASLKEILPSDSESETQGSDSETSLAVQQYGSDHGEAVSLQTGENSLIKSLPSNYVQMRDY